jgi:hypothetical protein
VEQILSVNQQSDNLISYRVNKLNQTNSIDLKVLVVFHQKDNPNIFQVAVNLNFHNNLLQDQKPSVVLLKRDLMLLEEFSEKSTTIK